MAAEYVFPPVNLDAVLQDVKEQSIALYGNKLDRIILYGSYARGDYANDSDVDVMILLDCTPEEVRELRWNTSKMASRIGLKNDALISLFPVDSNSFNKSKERHAFYKNILKDGVVVYG